MNPNPSDCGRNFNNDNQTQQTSLNLNQQNENQNTQGGCNSCTSHTGNCIKNGIHPQPMNTLNNNNRQQKNNQCSRTPGNNSATKLHLQQQETPWIRTQIQLQTIPVTLFDRDLYIEAYALPESGSDNTQITQTIANALQIQQLKDITLRLASLHGEHSVKTADIMIRIEALYSNCPVIRIFLYAKATSNLK